MDDSRIKAAREVLSAFFDEEKLRRGGRYAEFFSSWKSLVGEQLAAHSHVSDVKNGVLIVEAEHPGWIQLLQLRQSAILRGLEARFPELGLRSIAFRLGPGRPTTEPPERSPRSERSAGGPTVEDPPMGTEDREGKGVPQTIRSLEEIGDPALKVLLKGLKDTLDGGKPGK